METPLGAHPPDQHAVADDQGCAEPPQGPGLPTAEGEEQVGHEVRAIAHPGGDGEAELNQYRVDDECWVVQDTIDLAPENLAAEPDPRGAETGRHQDGRVHHRQEQPDWTSVARDLVHRLILGRADYDVNRLNTSEYRFRRDSHDG